MYSTLTRVSTVLIVAAAMIMGSMTVATATESQGVQGIEPRETTAGPDDGQLDTAMCVDGPQTICVDADYVSAECVEKSLKAPTALIDCVPRCDCEVTQGDPASPSTRIDVKPLDRQGKTVSQYYSYGSPNPWSAATDVQMNDTSVLFLYEDPPLGTGQLSLVTIHDDIDSTGGAVTFSFQNLPTGQWTVQDDGHQDFDSNTDSHVEWGWDDKPRTDGGAYSGDLCNCSIVIQPAFHSGISEWVWLNHNRLDPGEPQILQLDMSKELRINCTPIYKQVLQDPPVERA